MVVYKKCIKFYMGIVQQQKCHFLEKVAFLLFCHIFCGKISFKDSPNFYLAYSILPTALRLGPAFS